LSGKLPSNLISVVDDDASMCKMLIRMIGSVGLNVAAFTSAEEFLSSGRLAESACLILDVDLPGMSGIDLQRQLNESSQRLPIIFISGQSDEQTRKRALKAGAAGFFKKPFSTNSLLDAIHAFVTT
jgi:FixJ family two-component response regulator